MTLKQVMRFLENDDSTAIHFRRFNLSPKDKYPVFSICLTGAKLYWYKREPIFNKFQLSRYKLGDILKGKDAFAYEYNYTSMLYNKVPIDISQHPDVDLGHFSLKASDIVTALEYGTEHEKTSVRHGRSAAGNEKFKLVDKIPLQVGYNSSDTVCFTRTSDDSVNTLRTYDWLAFNNSVFGNEKFNKVDLRIYVHHPHQLMREFHRPVFRSKLGSGATSQVNGDFWSKLLKITITKVTTLRKRPGSNIGCDETLVNDDAKLQDRLIKQMNCTPPYWRRFDLQRKPCQSKAELQNAENIIQHYKLVLNSYTKPCVQMEVFAKFDREEEREWDEPSIMFMYDDRNYEEITNSQSFDLESFVSGVGGFIGIFLGYSILQIPELLASLTYFVKTLRQNNNTGKICLN